MPFDMMKPRRATLKQPEMLPEAPTAPTQMGQMGQPGMQQNMPLEQVLEAIAEYGDHGRALKHATTMQEVGQKLAHIAELAEHAVVSEAEDWYDAHTVKRNTSEMKKYASDFMKLAKEADMINQRMTALYEDMGRILERYFELPQNGDETPDNASASDDTVTGTGVDREDVPLEEATNPVAEDMILPTNPSEPNLPDEEELHSGKDRRKDEITLRAIKAVYARLKQKNPEMASKFAKLPPRKMEQAVWKLVDAV
jgi:hypothetical protein